MLNWKEEELEATSRLTKNHSQVHIGRKDNIGLKKKEDYKLLVMNLKLHRV